MLEYSLELIANGRKIQSELTTRAATRFTLILLPRNFGFLVRRAFLAPLTILFKRDIAFHLFLIFMGIIIPSATDGTLERD